ncbi:MAG: peptidylprolyl isomerase [Aggregatilineales bacterium]
MRTKRLLLLGLSLLIGMLAACTPPPTTNPTAQLLPTASFTVPSTSSGLAAAPPTRAPTQLSTQLATPAHAPDRILGPSNAFLTIILYGDFQSAPCLDVARSVEIIRETYQADVRLIWRDFPQPQNDKAQLAAQAAAAAADQGKFWEMHDQLLTHQSEWARLSIDQFHAKLADYARTVGLDTTRFYAAVDGGTELPALRKAINDAQALGFKGAPVLLFNGEPYSGRIDLYALDDYARLRLLEKRWFAHQPDLQIDLRKQYTATLTTEKGLIQIVLDAKVAPVTVNNFVFLARSSWYNAITFHLVIPGVLAQTGDPSGSGLGGPGYTIADEHGNGLLFDRAGQVAMASQRGTPNSGGSQFFITMAPLRPEADYDGQFTIFGHVTSGLDVLTKLTPRNPFDEQNYPNPPPGDKLISVTIQTQ